MSQNTLFDLHEQLGSPDSWRLVEGFSADMQKANSAMLHASTPGDAAEALRTWFRSHQPCVFGRFAAKLGRIRICILREDDIRKGDEHVREAIQQSRQAWREAALDGDEHSFVIALVTERLMYARPGPELLALAVHLLALYLPGDGVDDVVFDRVFLRVKGEVESFRQWQNGVNVFAAAGDKRWWHDHRIPAGLALATNVVGHMARSCVEDRTLTAPLPEAAERDRLVGWALPMAMTTIQFASKAPAERRGTWLLRREQGKTQEPPFCPSTFSRFVEFDWDKYGGAFQSDHTLPSPFFTDSVERPREVSDNLDLDFSYLHNEAELDYRLIGTGDSADPTVSKMLAELIAASEESDSG